MSVILMILFLTLFVIAFIIMCYSLEFNKEDYMSNNYESFACPDCPPECDQLEEEHWHCKLYDERLEPSSQDYGTFFVCDKCYEDAYYEVVEDERQ